MGRRDYSKKELRDKLKGKGFSPTEIEATIDKLDSYNYLKNENDLARLWLKNLSAKGKGPYFIQNALKKMGLPFKDLNQSADPNADYELEKQALLKALSSKRIDPQILIKPDYKNAAQIAKAKRYLMSRGFNLQRAMQILKDALES